MRTTIDLPDALYRRTKAMAGARGTTVKEMITRAVERELTGAASRGEKRKRVKLPIIRSRSGRKLDLTDFNFDDLLT